MIFLFLIFNKIDMTTKATLELQCRFCVFLMNSIMHNAAS